MLHRPCLEGCISEVFDENKIKIDQLINIRIQICSVQNSFYDPILQVVSRALNTFIYF